MCIYIGVDTWGDARDMILLIGSLIFNVQMFYYFHLALGQVVWVDTGSKKLDSR